MNKYRSQSRDYDSEIIEWLVGIYSEYEKQINKNIGSILKGEEFFFLYNSDKGFRSISYDCYSKLIKKFPFIKDQTEMLFLFIKDYHRAQSQPRNEFKQDYISDDIKEWIENTRRKYQVNLWTVVYQLGQYFYENEELWSTSHRKKSCYNFRKYDYDIKQKSNLFNLDSLHRKMPQKAYTKGRKQEFENDIWDRFKISFLFVRA